MAMVIAPYFGEEIGSNNSTKSYKEVVTLVKLPLICSGYLKYFRERKWSKKLQRNATKHK